MFDKYIVVEYFRGSFCSSSYSLSFFKAYGFSFVLHQVLVWLLKKPKHAKGHLFYSATKSFLVHSFSFLKLFGAYHT